MLKRFVIIAVVILAGYILFLSIQVRRNAGRESTSAPAEMPSETSISHRVQSFTFSKYTPEGKKEFEIEGDTADVFAKTVDLANVIAKTYASGSPVTVTADGGQFDRASGNIHLEKNVVAITESGARLFTEKLKIDPKRKHVETDVKVEVRKDNIDVEGIGAKGDSNLGQIQFKKNVTVIIHDKSGPDDSLTVITCDGPLDIDYEGNKARFNDNVVTKDKRGVLKADIMDVFYDKTTSAVDKIFARGNVVIVNNKGNESYSDEVIYLAKEGRIIMGGDIEGLYFPAGGDSGEEFFVGVDRINSQGEKNESS